MAQAGLELPIFPPQSPEGLGLQLCTVALRGAVFFLCWFLFSGGDIYMHLGSWSRDIPRSFSVTLPSSPAFTSSDIFTILECLDLPTHWWWHLARNRKIVTMTETMNTKNTSWHHCHTRNGRVDYLKSTKLNFRKSQLPYFLFHIR